MDVKSSKCLLISQIVLLPIEMYGYPITLLLSYDQFYKLGSFLITNAT